MDVHAPTPSTTHPNAPSTSRDVMTVSMPADQQSDDIFAAHGDLVGHYNTSQIANGMSICKSGVTTYITCGTITRKFSSAISEECDCRTYFTRAKYWSQDGDSGAPVYHAVERPNRDVLYYAVGIHGGRGGTFEYFTRIQDALGLLNVQLVTS